MADRRKQAAEWLLILEDPNVLVGEVLRWEAWMKRSERNRRAFEEVEQFSRQLDDNRDELLEIPIPTQQECDADVMPGPVVRGATVRGWAAQLGGGLERLAARRSWRMATVAAGIVVILTGAVYLNLPGALSPEFVEPIQSHRTAISEHREVVLPDGSAVAIGAKSSLTVNFTQARRIVVLEAGEALFEVAHDAKRPFIVMAGAGTITAVGTAFNVRREGNRVVVTVTEGTVEVMRTPPGPRDGISKADPQLLATTVSAGVQAVVSPTELSVVEYDNPTAVTEWQTGHLQYRAEPLRYVVADVSRYSAKEIIIADSEVETLVFTGSVFQDQTDDWLEALETAFPVEVIYVGNSKILIRKR